MDTSGSRECRRSYLRGNAGGPPSQRPVDIDVRVGDTPAEGRLAGHCSEQDHKVSLWTGQLVNSDPAHSTAE
jgi:hypothetical protein